MKVIDLLNKIANGEEVPEKIKYLGIEFSFQHNCIEYINDYGTCLIKNISGKSLNEEVEIIKDIPKEDKKIKKIDEREAMDEIFTYDSDGSNLYFLSLYVEHNIVGKINELIDKVNGK